MTGVTRVALAAGPLRAVVEGGPWLSVTSLTAGGRELLVGPEELPEAYRVHGRRAGITLLHPWGNRLSSDDGLPPGAPRDPAGAPVHGLPADGAGWSVSAVGDDLALATVAAAWPRPHHVAVRFALHPGGLDVTTELSAREPVPVAFGWHPYLRPAGPREDWRLTLPAHRRLTLDARGLPTGEATWCAAESGPLARRTFDDALDGIAPGAALAAGELEVVLDEGFPAAQVFAPGDADVVSLEPMAAPVDGLVSGAATWRERALARWSLAVHDAPVLRPEAR